MLAQCLPEGARSECGASRMQYLPLRARVPSPYTLPSPPQSPIQSSNPSTSATCRPTLAQHNSLEPPSDGARRPPRSYRSVPSLPPQAHPADHSPAPTPALTQRYPSSSHHRMAPGCFRFPSLSQLDKIPDGASLKAQFSTHSRPFSSLIV